MPVAWNWISIYLILPEKRIQKYISWLILAMESKGILHILLVILDINILNSIMMFQSCISKETSCLNLKTLQYRKFQTGFYYVLSLLNKFWSNEKRMIKYISLYMYLDMNNWSYLDGRLIQKISTPYFLKAI